MQKDLIRNNNFNYSTNHYFENTKIWCLNIDFLCDLLPFINE